jgi:hypothetical protein
VRPGNVVVVTANAETSWLQWFTPDLPLYGNDHKRGDLAP